AGIISNERVVGLSNAVMVFTSIAGSIAHLQAEPVYPSPWIIGHVYLPLAPLLFLGAQLGSPLGYWINHHLTLRRRRIAMAGMLLLITGQLAYRLLTT
ncbi:MAG: sulfite exporter TauE/SafE family protein, partial [Chloroflexi bacterium]|nr:sulfite exporter TauE/SafE family protein [Chloroflexota bacterium]